MASMANTLMLSYYCPQEFKTAANRDQHSTFVNVKPRATDVARAVASLLLKYHWRKVTLIYNAEDESHRRTGESIKGILQSNGIQIRHTYPTAKRHYYMGLEYNESYKELNPFIKIVDESKNSTRIYVLVADEQDSDSPVALMTALDNAQLLDSGEYFVVGAYIGQYRSKDPGYYIHGIFEDPSKASTKAFRSFLGVIRTSSASEYREFKNEVNYWLTQPPFNFDWTDPDLEKIVLPEAAHLYDAVFLYARALQECLSNVPDCHPQDGKQLYKYIVDKPYRSVMGYDTYIDADGQNSHGNYSLLAMRENLPTDAGNTTTVGLLDIGIFHLNNNRSDLPVLTLKMSEKIHWPNGRIPRDEPVCGFDGQNCADGNRDSSR